MMGRVVPVTGDARTVCEVCHRVHLNVARLLGPNAPDDWLAVSKGERLEAELTPDICILPDQGATRHYIRGHLQLPVSEPQLSPFVWSVWVELDEWSMAEIAQHWSDPDRASMAPLTGWLATELPYEEPTKGLMVTLQNRGLGEVPLVRLAAGVDHRLATEQHNGVRVHRLAEFGQLLHL